MKKKEKEKWLQVYLPLNFPQNPQLGELRFGMCAWLGFVAAYEDQVSMAAAADSLVTLREWLGQGPFSLSLSSSWLGLFCHAGVVCALAECGLSPSKICGSSGES